MNPTQADVNRAVAKANELKAAGYFGRVQQGDQRAASYFVRELAFQLNPNGNPSDYGALSKSPGETQVDGFAEDAICFGNQDADRQNVVDMINGAGAPGASIGGAIKERRENNRWVKPAALTDDQRSYLLSGGQPIPIPPQSTMPSYEALGGDEGAKQITRVLEHDYKLAGRPGLDGDCGGWLRRTDYDFLSAKIPSVSESIIVHRDEWLVALGLITTTPGMMSDSDQCKICGASVGYERGKRRPIPHAGDCLTRSSLKLT